MPVTLSALQTSQVSPFNQNDEKLKTFQKTELKQFIQALSTTKSLISAPDSLPLDDFLSLLARNDILSVPIANSSGNLIGILGILDVLDYIVFSVCDDVEKDFAYAIEKLKRPVSVIFDGLDSSKEAYNLWMYSEYDTVGKITEVLSKGVHRVLVDQPRRIITQSDILKYIQRNPETILSNEFLDSSLENHGLYPNRAYGVAKPVISCKDDVTAVRAFKTMALNSVTAVPIVDRSTGAILSTISIADLRGLDALQLQDLLLPVTEYLKKHNSSRKHVRQLTASPKTTFREAMITLVDGHVHHLWVLDAQHKPVGCVTLTDLMSKLSPFDYLK